MRSIAPLCALAVGIALAVPASALEECHGDDYAFSFQDPVTGDTYYVVNDLCQLSNDCLYSVWIYKESNGHAGLQRCDDKHDDNCTWGNPGCPDGSDEIIF